MKKLVIVSDWASDGLSSQEFTSVVEGYLKDPTNRTIGFVSSTPSTIHTTYLTSQLVETEERYGRPQETVIFQNTDTGDAEFIIVRLKSGLFVCGPNAGFSFSMIKPRIDELYHYSGFPESTQFRSRDSYARVCAHLIDEMEDDLDLEEGSTDIIPELQGYFIGHIDSFGNIKTTIPREDIKGTIEFSDSLPVAINTITKDVILVEHLSSDKPGVLVIYPGSSGPKDNPFMEISGTLQFGSPKPGDEIIIRT